MDEVKSFDSIEKLENFLMEYMEEHGSMELYVYMRYGYTQKGMKEENFKVEICGLYNSYEILWWNDWNEGQDYSEVFSIMTEKELEKIMREK